MMWKEYFVQYRRWIALFGVMLVLGGVFLLKTSNERKLEPQGTIKPQSTPRSAKSESHHSKSKRIAIDVKGHVVNPGVYFFETSPMVLNVIKAAGGFKAGVKDARLNLAVKLHDQAVIYVPHGDDEVPADYPIPGIKVQQTTRTDQNVININQANATELTQLPGIGIKRAEDIIAFRQTKGPFKTIEALKSVSGIGEKIFARINAQITV